MTPAELIELLKKFPPHAQVVLWDHDLSTESEPAVMRLRAEHVQPLTLAWGDGGGIGWVEVARSGSLAVVPGVVLGSKERTE